MRKSLVNNIYLPIKIITMSDIKLTIYDKIKIVLENKESLILSRGTLIKELKKKFEIIPESVLPSDFCYNTTNKKLKFNKHLFEHLSDGNYRYLGENYSYNGLIYHKRSGGEQELIGEWKDGKKTLYYTDEKNHF